MLNERERILRRILVVVDASVVSLAFVLAFVLRKYFIFIYRWDLLPGLHVVSQPALISNDYLAVYFFVVIFWSLALIFNGMYRSVPAGFLMETVVIIIKCLFWVTLTFSVAVFLLKLKFISRLFFVLFMLFSALLLALEKAIIFAVMRRHLRHGYNCKRLLIVGTNKRARHVMDTIEAHPEWGYDIVKVVDYAQCLFVKSSVIQDCEVVRNEEDMLRVLIQHHIDQVIFVIPRSGLHLVENYIFTCENQGVDTAIAVDFINIKMSHLRHTDLDGIPLITLEKRFDKEGQLFVKRAADIVFSGLGLLILSPLFLVVMTVIRLTSPGPVFFLQERVSLRGRKFVMYKFRSMYREAEKELQKLLSLNEVEGPIFKIKNDPRITPVGRFLRKFSIDELPQLFNVFVGRMSLVGPRPALPREVEQYAMRERRRLSVRPGITCLWQAYHRGEKDFDKWMESDLDYVDDWSLSLDFKILVKTIIGVMTGRGAY